MSTPPPDTGALPSPPVVGPYRLVRRLGAGGMAQVFEAVRFGASGFERRVALKVLLPEHEGDPSFMRILIDEAKTAAALSHQSLVRVDELSESGGTYYVVMELVDGVDLATLLASLPRGAMPVSLALTIAAELAIALSYLHGAASPDGRPLRLVHRDVSPGNVLVSRAGEVKLADFGIAKALALTDRSVATSLKGKIAYMSPEQASGDTLDERTDLFSLGAVLAELLTGRRPFEGDNAVETLDRVRAAAPPPLSAVPEAAAEVVRSLLQRDRAHRPASAEAAYDALRRAAAASGEGLASPFDLARLLTGES